MENVLNATVEKYRTSILSQPRSPIPAFSKAEANIFDCYEELKMKSHISAFQASPELHKQLHEKVGLTT